ncbi:YkvA family protein [Clostridium sp. CX1]|uniref:YkvA family protein n=1 Tax=Clostridium sp. CX1 TaxID=2978346 RepID=UPI0021C0918A|nr:YkvA family protein [Clostridium sp. CX1]MCT8975164.1 YkvA family protein [Clostridium sp. CX1]
MENKLKDRFRIWFSTIKQKSKKIKEEIGALYFAYKRPDVPFYAKLVSILVVGYALSPIDLIPDFIPILGYLDDLILLPLGIAFAIKLIPSNIMNECRQQLENIFSEGKPQNWIAGGIIICIWIIIVSYILVKII